MEGFLVVGDSVMYLGAFLVYSGFVPSEVSHYMTLCPLGVVLMVFGSAFVLVRV